MEKNKFSSIMILLVPQVIELIATKDHMDEQAAAIAFYNSELYGALEDEETKLWHLSPLMLYTLYREEIENGKIHFPEEA